MMPALPLMPTPASGELGLIELGEEMKEPEAPPPTTTLNTPKVGYTYLGQFIDHDLTLDFTPLGLARGSDLSQMVNRRNPRLDLEHVYGGEPQAWPFLYERATLRLAPRFLVGPTVARSINGVLYPSSRNDLPRNSEGIALVADHREDQNLILAQLHVAFLKLHNAIIDRPELLAASPSYGNAGSIFEAARRMLTWHYQWVVRYDGLRQVLDPEVFNRLPELEAKKGAQNAHFQIPVEFSLGAFRFGHSMVREHYFYNDAHPKASLQQLLEQTGGGGAAFAGLPADWVIDWRRFFFVGGGSGMARHSSAIDTRVAKGMHNLPGGPISVRTMQRGDRVGLPSGQAAAMFLGVKPLTTKEMLTSDHAAILRRYGYEKQTPLWYYILMEAELLEKGGKGKGQGEKLGPVGSHIVARVIMDALFNDPTSYLSVAPNWTPTLPGPANPRLFGMANLLRLILKP